MPKADGTLTFFESVSTMGCPHCGAMSIKTINAQGEHLGGTVQHKDDCSWMQGWKDQIKEMRK